MNCNELPLWISCADDTLLGLLSMPANTELQAIDRAVIVVVGGPQYRAGSHRQFTLLARALAAEGMAVLRFDHRGIGDSSGSMVGFEHLAPDIGAAVSAVREQLPSVRQVGLLGLCDGAAASLLYLAQARDAGIEALCLLNPWVRTAETLAQTEVKHYYVRRVLQREFWRKLLLGHLQWRAVREFMQSMALTMRSLRPRSTAASAEARDFRTGMLDAMREFKGQALIVTSGRDFVAREFTAYVDSQDAWRKTLGRPNIRRCVLDGADHTFSSPLARSRLHEEVLNFFARQPQRDLA